MITKPRVLALALATAFLAGCEKQHWAPEIEHVNHPDAKVSYVARVDESCRVYRLDLEGRSYLVNSRGGIVLHERK